MKRLLTALVLASALCALGAQDQTPPYIATTRWVAAIAELAGLSEVPFFAPADLSHPPEYELKPGDLLRLSKARFVLAAGYERPMMLKINEALSGSGFTLHMVKTENSLATLAEETAKIAALFNTGAQRDKNLAAYANLVAAIKKELADRGQLGKGAYVHFHQQPLARDLGFEILGVYGPGPVTPAQLVEAARLKPFIIIDNVHNPVGKPLTEAAPTALYAAFLNFPGLYGTRSIMDVVSYNRARLAEAKTGKQ